jgi:hypothetical protein
MNGYNIILYQYIRLKIEINHKKIKADHRGQLLNI